MTANASSNRRYSLRGMTVAALLLFLAGLEIGGITNFFTANQTTIAKSAVVRVVPVFETPNFQRHAHAGYSSSGQSPIRKEDEEIMFQRMAQPLVLQYPSTIRRHGNGVMEYLQSGKYCTTSVCGDDPMAFREPQDGTATIKAHRYAHSYHFPRQSKVNDVYQRSVETYAKPVVIEGDVIAMPWSDHYFHFVYETAIQLESIVNMRDLGMSNTTVIERYPNATLLLFMWHPKEVNLEMLDVLKIRLPPHILSKQQDRQNKWNINYRKGQDGIIYQATGRVIVPAFNNYHPKVEPYKSYNQYMIERIRRRVLPGLDASSKDEAIASDGENNEYEDNNKAIKKGLFLSRKGYRRGILQEDELFQRLSEQFRLMASTSVSSPAAPGVDLKNIFPDDFSVLKQARMFADADLIISPHGAALTNLIFVRNTTKTTVVEITPAERPRTFRNDLPKIRHHYLLTCPSEPGDKDVWGKQMDCSVSKMVDTIVDIWLRQHTANVSVEEIQTIHSFEGGEHS